MITLSEGERNMLARRRLGLTQEQFGALHGVSQDTVSAWERGIRTLPSAVKLHLHPPAAPCELAMVQRRRAGISVHRAAKALGVSHVTILAWEQGKAGVERYTSELVALTNGDKRV